MSNQTSNNQKWLCCVVCSLRFPASLVPVKRRERDLYYKKYIWCKYSQINYTKLKKEYIQNYQNSNNKKPKQSSTSYSKDPYKLQIILPQKTKPNFFITQKPKKKSQIIKHVSYIRKQINNNQITEQTIKIL